MCQECFKLVLNKFGKDSLLPVGPSLYSRHANNYSIPKSPHHVSLCCLALLNLFPSPPLSPPPIFPTLLLLHLFSSFNLFFLLFLLFSLIEVDIILSRSERMAWAHRLSDVRCISCRGILRVYDVIFHVCLRVFVFSTKMYQMRLTLSLLLPLLPSFSPSLSPSPSSSHLLQLDLRAAMGPSGACARA